MKSFGSRVFLLILIPTVTVFLFISIAGVNYFDEALKKQALSKKQLELGLSVRSIDDWLISRISDMVLLSRNGAFSVNEREDIRKVLIGEQRRLSFFYEKFWIIQPNGNYWNTNDETGNMEGHKILESFVLEDKYSSYIIPEISDPIVGDSIILAIPVRKNGELEYVFSASIPFLSFNRLILYFASDFFDEVMVVNTSGTIISHSKRDLIGKKEIDIYQKIFSVNTELENSHAFSAILKNKWKLVGFIENKNIFHNIKKINQFSISLIVGSLLIIVLVSFVIMRIVANPIQILTAGVERVTKGDYGQKIMIKSTEEINTLANTFNRMTQQLSKSRTDDRFIFLGHISARMAHEIRKPMNIIQLIAQAVKKRGEFRDEDYNSIVNEISNADRFVREIFDFVEPEDLSLSLYSIKKLILTVIQKFNLEFESKNIRSVLKLQEDIPGFYMDIFRMEQVLSNVIKNSIQSIGEQGKIEIYLNQNINSKEVVLKICDTGAGIPENIIDKIFDPYFTTKKDGIGIGLSLSYRILMSHGAKLEAFNIEGSGLMIQITFMSAA